MGLVCSFATHSASSCKKSGPTKPLPARDWGNRRAVLAGLRKAQAHPVLTNEKWLSGT